MRLPYGSYVRTNGWSTNGNAPTGDYSWTEGRGGVTSVTYYGYIEIERIPSGSGTRTNLYLRLNSIYEDLKQYAFVDFTLLSGDTSIKYSANISRIFYKNSQSYV
jgi:hypothetical protein